MILALEFHLGRLIGEKGSFSLTDHACFRLDGSRPRSSGASRRQQPLEIGAALRFAAP